MMEFEEVSEMDKQAENNRCLICGVDIDSKATIFEQRLIEDKDFCGKCFSDILNDSDGETIVLPRLTVLRR